MAVLLLDTSPQRSLNTISGNALPCPHDLGHLLGLNISKYSGYDLSKELERLNSCFKSSSSIGLKHNQLDEADGDYFSAEVLAKQMHARSEEQRLSYILNAMSFFCTAEISESSMQFAPKEDHPEIELRVAGIYGANPSLRRSLGCVKPSGKYQTCGLGVSILDLPPRTEAKAKKGSMPPSSESERSRK